VVTHIYIYIFVFKFQLLVTQLPYWFIS